MLFKANVKSNPCGIFVEVAFAKIDSREILDDSYSRKLVAAKCPKRKFAKTNSRESIFP